MLDAKRLQTNSRTGHISRSVAKPTPALIWVKGPFAAAHT